MVNATTAKLSSMHFHGWEKGSLSDIGEGQTTVRKFGKERNLTHQIPNSRQSRLSFFGSKHVFCANSTPLRGGENLQHLPSIVMFLDSSGKIPP